MKKENQKFEEILSESTLLDSEMEALRGGTNDNPIRCGVGLIAECNVGVTEPIKKG